jgi:hypothetical protein
MQAIRDFWAKSAINKLVVIAVVGLFCCCPLSLAGQGRNQTAQPAATDAPTAVSVAATSTPEPSATPEPTETPASTSTPEQTATRSPVATSGPTAPPLPTIGPVPLTIEGLSPLLIQPGDLPEGWTGDTLFDEPPVDYVGPAPVLVLNQGLLAPGDRFSSGGVIVYILETAEDAQQVFKARTDLITRNVDKDVVYQRPPIGEQALLAPGKGQVFILNQLVSVRCNAVIEILLGTSDQVDMTINYARNIDSRITASVCE